MRITLAEYQAYFESTELKSLLGSFFQGRTLSAASATFPGRFVDYDDSPPGTMIVKVVILIFSACEKGRVASTKKSSRMLSGKC
ncbi:MAG TPA: hypothetical protein VF130_04905, partial [Candidatus Binatia bacterium]